MRFNAVPVALVAALLVSGTAWGSPWKKATAGTELHEGVIALRTGPGKLLAELAPEDLDRDLGLQIHISRGLGDLDVVLGLQARTVLVRFVRDGERVLVVQRNTGATAAPGSAIGHDLDRAVGHSILGAAPIEGTDPKTGNLLVNLTDLVLADLLDAQSALAASFPEGMGPMFDRDRSYIERAAAYPRNDEVDVVLTFAGQAPPLEPAAGLPDYRSVPVGVRYSLYALPDEPMRSRLGDDRVGYFETARVDFSRDRDLEVLERVIQRWRLEKADPTAAISKPVQPIVYWLDPSIPEEYRPTVRAAVLAWNVAFRDAGFDGAIEVRDAPTDDPSWSAEDVRYSTIRWVPAFNMGYAIGPSIADPRSGEILDADILVWSDLFRFWQKPDSMLLVDDASALSGSRACAAMSGIGQQVALAQTVLGPASDQPAADAVLLAGITWIIQHEVGHTLGLRHNFRGSSDIDDARVADRAYAAEHGLSASVMDYLPIHVGVRSDPTWLWWNPVIGSYDRWAITYGYQPLTPEEEPAALVAIAGKASEPGHAYLTDEETWQGALAPDPLAMAFDEGSDPLRFARERADLVRKVLPSLPERMVSDGEPWWKVRLGLEALLFERYRGTVGTLKWVGGLRLDRAYRTDGAAPTFTPIPAARQREGLQFLLEDVLGPDAFPVSADVLARAAPRFAVGVEVWWGWTYWNPGAVDYPLHARVLEWQTFALTQLFDPARLARIRDNEARVAPSDDRFTMVELFRSTTDALWSELSAKPAVVTAGRRDLQRAHVEILGQLLHGDVRVDSLAPVPGDASALARVELATIRDRVTAARAGASDPMTKAHLEAVVARAQKLLDADVELTAPGR